MKKALIFLVLLNFIVTSKAQNVGIGTTTPSASAELDVSSTNKGFLPPRMTAVQRAHISSPANGLLVFQTDYPSGLYYFNSGMWSSVTTPIHYPSVTICNQKWMDKNLDVITYSNGDTIAYITDAATWASLTTGAWCYYNNDPSNNAIYGKLYNWYAVNDPRGLAPAGWHVPNETDWATLETCLSNSSVEGGKLKVSGITTWRSPNTGANNSSGWSALPGGLRYDNGTLSYTINENGYWWSASASGNDIYTAFYRKLYYQYNYVSTDKTIKNYGLSVRCLRD